MYIVVKVLCGAFFFFWLCYVFLLCRSPIGLNTFIRDCMNVVSTVHESFSIETLLNVVKQYVIGDDTT